MPGQEDAKETVMTGSWSQDAILKVAVEFCVLGTLVGGMPRVEAEYANK